MRARLILKPGQRGTKKLCAEYGERLVCVRYRYDEKRHKRLETVELVVVEVDWEASICRCTARSSNLDVRRFDAVEQKPISGHRLWIKSRRYF